MDIKKNIRLIDVARKAGVSVSAVSKALLDKDDIGEETKSRILRIADEMNYTPNNIARSLRLGKTNLLGIIIPDNTNPYYSIIIKGAVEEARKYFFTTIITNTYENPKMESDAIKSLLSLPVDGLLAIPYRLENYKDIDIPLIFLSRYLYREISFEYKSKKNRLGNNYVVNDDYEGQYIATTHLIKQGKKDIYALLDENTPKYVKGIKTLIRLDGHRRALADAGIAYDASKVFFGINTLEKAYEIVNRICMSANKPFGLSMINDYVSIGALRSLQDCKLKIPSDVDIIGYDDIELSSYLSVSLTTIHVAKYSIGEQGAHQIINSINNNSRDFQKINIIFRPYLVEHGSRLKELNN